MILRYLPLLLLALAWEIGARTGLISTLALPPLSAVLAAWVDLVRDGELITNGAAFRNPGQGAIDEFAIWHEELSAAEIAAQFNALVAHPRLGIAIADGNAILSWPNTTPASYVLQAAPALVGQTWTNAGSPVIVGSNFVVTNALSSSASFFRLHKP